MSSPITVLITYPDETNKEVTSTTGTTLNLPIGNTDLPGQYNLKITSEELSSEKTFQVLEKIELDAAIEGNELLISNLGNVLYEETIFLELEKEGKMITLVLKSEIEVGEKETFDIGTKTEDGTYNLKLTTKALEKEWSNIVIEDHRNGVKKAKDGLYSITGALTWNSENGSKTPMYLVIVAIIIIVLAIVFHQRVGSKLKKVIKKQDEAPTKTETVQLKNELFSEQQNNKQLQKIIEQYIDKQVVKEHLQDGNTGMTRKEISVLFTDMRGFSKLFGEFQDEEIIQLLNSYFEKSSKTIKQHGGLINKFIGDSVMALFNATKPQQDHVMQAICSALTLQEELKELDTELQKKGYPSLKVGIGISTGMASVGYLGGKEKLEYTAIGVPVNTAFRMQGKAQTGEVIISEATYKRVKDKIEVEEIGEEEFKNIQGKIKLFRVLSVRHS
ncbi:adenylate/guanylate cyclase domain-containing protein [Candidatus Woesearchaeota archaeon]|jgi:class 3 adenylate cyclase|nr:adenylate/guanylate cyclase domain-containing protein [Candidatus Woesearchaeota archaeon]MBT4368431.1 adenylate/guanylate cyclase domain-containing protein [Candidatus Woesearchaeota archaeon]MBT4712920.1 adenylate/guanylate cyclase domain-containing protein [Candidatus Woesearchaeota archaeon]MBT6639832.1 adenylate/guanylate cyclase domain-containing protein [Candidatus Woesearchaeota archaeon]MBT7134004.1 adenylate/guanylate cyclase domain-containing protein [Candidatus Woesearchaeota arc